MGILYKPFVYYINLYDQKILMPGIVKTKLNTNAIDYNLIDMTCTKKIELESGNNLKTFPCLMAECKRDFSMMYIICTNLQSCIIIYNISTLILMKINPLHYTFAIIH